MRARTHVHTLKCTHTRVQLTNTCRLRCKREGSYLHIFIWLYIYIYIYSYDHTCTYTCTRSLPIHVDCEAKEKVHIRGCRGLDTPVQVRYDSWKCVTWLVDMCDMTQSYVWHDTFTHPYAVSCLDTPVQVRYDSWMCVTWLNHMCDMTHLLIHMRFSWSRHACIGATWLVHMYDMTRSYVLYPIYVYDSFICICV